MMKRQWTVLLFLVGLFLTGCGPQPEIEGDLEESYLGVDEERGMLTVYARIANHSALPSGDLYAQFEITHEGLANQISENGVIVFTDSHGEPQLFRVNGHSGYFLAESFEMSSPIALEELSEAVEVVIFNEEDEEVTRYAIKRVTEE